MKRSLSVFFTVILLWTIANSQENKSAMDANKSPNKKEETLPAKEKSTETQKDDKKQIERADKTETQSEKDKPKDESQETKKFKNIMQTLDYGIQKDRKAAIGMINDIKNESYKREILLKITSIATSDSDIEMRKSAITAIGDNKFSDGASAIIAGLEDEASDVKIAACYAVGKLKLQEAKDKLVEVLKKQDLSQSSNFTDAIIIALTELEAKDILEFAATEAKNQKNSKMIRERLLLYIGKCGSAEQFNMLTEIYKDDEEEMSIRSYAVKSMGRLKIKEAIPVIKEVVKEIDSYSFNKRKRYYDLYMQSVTALVELGDESSVSLLMNSLRSDNSDVRYKAILLIKDFNDERTIDILKYKMKNDPSAKVRNAARKALEDKGLVEKGSPKESEVNDEKSESAEQ
ncbi:MAG TPA: HEAT repeat domain-containing protein [Spirochaetota bacterium]|nr:HEAT repeat domain-containing protein [Spirochaetota bacterium]HOK00933.1 HEAT repeat domain-containing protein [Spirochaetota bacterium]HOK91269.1 HEAT repeat domain-containing protein [Spirochaetota bacterium]HON15965.1 HEAT repeat domain-containing protein [Spirochaetota bacterium]HPP94392.1 HEAT repeat domain-containing protein [Spirochaetota bacterium]